MGKQAAGQRAALANALLAPGKAPVKAPEKKEDPKPVPKPKAKKKEEPKEEVKTKEQLEEEHRQYLEEKELDRKQFFETEAAKKLKECKGIDVAVTYVEDRDTRKPVAVSDLSDHWRVDLGFMPFMPSDNVGSETPDDVDPDQRLEFLQLFNNQLQQLLRMRFHVFWSQVIYDPQVMRALDTYLWFCLRRHDVAQTAEAAEAAEATGTLEGEEGEVTKEIARRVLAVLLRLSRPEETTNDFITPAKFGELILEHRIFDVPKLIDICAIYGDANASTVTRIVHSVFSHQPRYKADFESAVQHMLGGLHQCCAPLQQSGAKTSRPSSVELGIDECLTFLPDVLSCFNAVFCYFPEDCIELLVVGQLDGKSRKTDTLPLAEVMVLLHESLVNLEKRGGKTRLSDIKSLFSTIRTLLCRLLSCVLGSQFAPRKGSSAFDDLLEWCKTQAERTELLHDLARYGLENVVIEWHASGLVDEARMDFLEQIFGQTLLPPEARAARRQAARASTVKATGSTTAGTGAAAASSRPANASAATSNGSSANDAAKIREVRDICGEDFGEGFLLQCLSHYGFSVPATINAILDENLPAKLDALPRKLKLHEISSIETAPELQRTLSAEDKKRIVEQNSRMEREAIARAEAAEEAKEKARGTLDEYDDDFDDTFEAGFRVGRQESESEGSDAEEDGDSEEDDGDPRWRDQGNKGKGKGKGKGKYKDKGPVQGQTYQARRKEVNKSHAANHNRRDQARKKMSRGMM